MCISHRSSSYRTRRIIRYLKGETIEIEDGREYQRCRLAAGAVMDGYPLGWESRRGTLRNKYFSGWRMNA
ncbi:MAG: methyltransferase RsmF C-terminal domain-like protein [Clostridia bacterium]